MSASHGGWRGRLAAGAAALLVGLSAVACSGDDPARATGAAVESVDRSIAGSAAPTGPGTGDETGGAPSTVADTPRADAQTSTATSQPDVPAIPDPVTLAFGGDILLHMPVNDRARQYGQASGRDFDFSPMLSPLAPVLDLADVALCHLEVPVAPDGRLTSYPSFGAPTEIADGIAAAGYEGCSTASNHSLDRGYPGVISTLEQLDRVGLRHAGTARGPWETGPGLYRVGDVDIAHLSYSYGFNGYRLPADAPWAAAQIDVDRIERETADARRSGAELVVVSLHWGTEYRHDPDAFQRSVADQLLPSTDIDMLIGHHAHVVQPIEFVQGTYVVWGLGNQLSNQTQAPRRDGLTVLATAELGWDLRWRFRSIEAVPTWVDIGTHRVIPVPFALRNPATPPGLRGELQGSYDRTKAILDGTPTFGVTIPSPN